VIHAEHRNVPVGTIADHEGEPVTIARDYSHGLIPAMELTVDGPYGDDFVTDPHYDAAAAWSAGDDQAPASASYAPHKPKETQS
jgi:hypothetical protein